MQPYIITISINQSVNTKLIYYNSELDRSIIILFNLPLIRILDIAEKRMRKAMAKKAPFGPAMYPLGTGRFEMIPMGTLPKNRPRDTPKVVPLEDDIIYDNRKSAGSEMRRDDGDSRRDMP